MSFSTSWRTIPVPLKETSSRSMTLRWRAALLGRKSKHLKNLTEKRIQQLMTIIFRALLTLIRWLSPSTLLSQVICIPDLHAAHMSPDSLVNNCVYQSTCFPIETKRLDGWSWKTRFFFAPSQVWSMRHFVCDYARNLRLSLKITHIKKKETLFPSFITTSVLCCNLSFKPLFIVRPYI